MIGLIFSLRLQAYSVLYRHTSMEGSESKVTAHDKWGAIFIQNILTKNETSKMDHINTDPIETGGKNGFEWNIDAKRC